jgi:glycosyltransferase involved in cell wall biosynthesis
MKQPFSNGQMPLVSFIVPCFNQGKFLFAALDSIKSGYSGPKEVIVIDDASDDELTDRKMRQMSARYPEVKFIQHASNKGLSASRNDGLASAAGDYIQFLDADDIIFRKKVDFQVMQLSMTANVDVSITDFRVYDENLSSWYVFPRANDQYRLDFDDFLFRWEREFIIPIHSAIFRKTLFQDLKFEESLVGKEDWVFWCTVASKGYKLGYIPILGAAYRRHGQAMTVNRKTEMANEYLEASQLIAAKIINHKKRNLFIEHSKKWFDEYYDSSFLPN